MSVVGELVERIKDAAAKADELFFLKAELCCDGVCRAKADAPYIVCQPVGILPNHTQAALSVGLVDLRSMRCTDIVGLEKEHDVLDLFLLLPAFFDPLNALLPYTRHLKQAVWALLDDVQGVFTELSDDPLREFGTNALDHTAAKILLDAKHCRRQCLLKMLHCELPPVLRIDSPCSA